MEEICLCHGEVWGDRIDLLEHQIQFYMKKAEKNRKEAAIFRAALAREDRKARRINHGAGTIKERRKKVESI